jgi:hypothetical protein
MTNVSSTDSNKQGFGARVSKFSQNAIKVVRKKTTRQFNHVMKNGKTKLDDLKQKYTVYMSKNPTADNISKQVDAIEKKAKKDKVKLLVSQQEKIKATDNSPSLTDNQKTEITNYYTTKLNDLLTDNNNSRIDNAKTTLNNSDKITSRDMPIYDIMATGKKENVVALLQLLADDTTQQTTINKLSRNTIDWLVKTIDDESKENPHFASLAMSKIFGTKDNDGQDVTDTKKLDELRNRLTDRKSEIDKDNPKKFPETQRLYAQYGNAAAAVAKEASQVIVGKDGVASAIVNQVVATSAGLTGSVAGAIHGLITNKKQPKTSDNGN